MQLFSIGQRVQFTHHAVSDYWEKDIRTIRHIQIEPTIGIIVGKQHKQEGTCHPGSSGGWYNDGEIEPPYFEVSKVVTLWQIRTSWFGKPVLVGDEYVKAYDKGFVVPNQSTKLKEVHHEEQTTSSA